MSKNKAQKPNPTDARLDRQKGGGYQYEWELGLEVALISLHPQFKSDWNCAKTEIPIPHHLREWLGDIESIAFDATGTAKKRLEDINLFGRTGNALYIQVKSSKSLSLKQLEEIVNKFATTEAGHKGTAPNFLLIAQGGVAFQAHRHPGSLLSWFQDREQQDVKKAFISLKNSLGKYAESLLDRVWVVRGPLHERLVAANLYLVGRLREFDCGSAVKREETFRHRSSIADTFKQRCSLKLGNFVWDELKDVVESPPGLAALLSHNNLDPSVVDNNPDLQLLEQLLGWDLERHVGPFLEEIVLALKPAITNERSLVTNLRDCFSQTTYDLEPHKRSSEAELFCLAFCRIATLLAGSLTTKRLQQAASKGEPLALPLCWLALGFSVRRHRSTLSISLHRVPEGYRFIEEDCRQYIENLESCLSKSAITRVSVDFNLERKEPDWLPPIPSLAGEKQPETPDVPEGSTERDLAEQLKHLRAVSKTGPKGAEVSESALQKTYQHCRVQGHQSLLIDTAEALAEALETLDRHYERREVLLTVSEDKLYLFGQGGFFRHNESAFEGLKPSDGLQWYRWKFLCIQVELRAGRFRTAEKLLDEIDSDERSILRTEEDRVIARARIAELRALLVHKGAAEAQARALTLLYRLVDSLLKERWQTLLVLAHSAYWSESGELMRTAVLTITRELERFPAPEPTFEIESLKVCLSGLQWLLASTNEEFNSILKRWTELSQTVTNRQAWAQLQIMRANLEFRRPPFSLANECSRKAAIDIRREARPAELILAKGQSEIAAAVWTGALNSVLTTLDVSLATNDWETLKEARRHLCQLWLADGVIEEALDCFAAYGAPFSNSSVERELLEKVDEALLDTTLPRLLELQSPVALQRVWKFLEKRAELLSKKNRAKVLVAAQQTFKTKFLFREDYFARLQLLKALSQLLRCPTDQEEVLTISNIFLDQLESANVTAFDDEIPSMIRRGFWSATGLHLKGRAAHLFLKRLFAVYPKVGKGQGKEAIEDIVLSVGLNSKEAAVQQEAREFLEAQKASKALAEWDARRQKPSKKDIGKALERALELADERVERTETGIWHHIGSGGMWEVSPFVKHFTRAQIKQFLFALIRALKDPDTSFLRKQEVVSAMKHPEIRKAPKILRKEARTLLLAALKGDVEKNALDRDRAELNRSIYSGLKLDVEADQRFHESICMALATLYVEAPIGDLAIYFRALLEETEGGEIKRCKNVARSLQSFFQQSGSSDSIELVALEVKLLAHTDAGVQKEALKAIGDRVYQQMDIDDLTQSMIDGIITTAYKKLTLRKGLAVFSRLATDLPNEHPHHRWAIDLNQRLCQDSNPVVCRLADTTFWDRCERDSRES